MAKILIVDDERPTLDMLSLLLEAMEHEVLTAENGEEGIEVFKSARPEMVITDIKMPGMNGIDVLKRIKEADPLTEVIVVTGHGDMDIAIQALNLNATDFINKPVRKEALQEALNRASERIAMAREGADDMAYKDEQQVAVLDVHGSVTSRSEAMLKESFNKAVGAGAKGMLLRFGQNATVNGAGIAVLTQLMLEASGRGWKMAMVGLSENFQKVFEVVGITKFARLFDDEQEARQYLEDS